MENKTNLLDLTLEELEEFIKGLGCEKFRGKQVYSWLMKGAGSIEDMTNLSKTLRQQLSDVSYVGLPVIKEKLVSKIDGTTKYLFELSDGNIIESVLMEYKFGLSSCISSQVGCKMGCSFCASAGAGFIRNLTAGEMLGQIIAIQKDTGKRIGNIVIMGIGEPLDNYDNLLKFLKQINRDEGLNVGARRITLSTCGLVPEILRLSRENLQVNLAISLHAPNDSIREKIMPINKKYAIDKIIEACKIYTEVTKRRITFEYTMIEGVNDSREAAAQLAKRLKGMLCHVNLIPVNTVKGGEFRYSSKQVIAEFKSVLEQWGIETTLRRELGSDINAACGQLRRSLINA